MKLEKIYEKIYEQIYEEVDHQLIKLRSNISDLFDITHNEIEDDLQSESLFAINIRITKLYDDSMDLLMIISEKILIDTKDKLVLSGANVYELMNIYFEIKKYINSFVRDSILKIDRNVNLLYFNILKYIDTYALN